MNWLQKLCQTTSDDTSHATSRAEEYFGIGHGDFSEESGFEPAYIVWAYINGQIEVGPLSHGEGAIEEDDSLSSSTHGTLWGHHITDKTYKGRFEPETGRLSIVKPAGREMFQVPQSVLDALNAKFGFIGRITVF